MKNILKYLGSILLFVCLAVSCEEEPVETLLLEIDRTNMKMTVGQSQQLNAVLKGKDGMMLWESDASDVASVDEEGVVYAHSAGKANILVSAAGITQKCAVEVIDFTATDLDLNSLFEEEEEGKYSYLMLKGATVSMNHKFYKDGEKVNDRAYPKFAVTESTPSRTGETVVTVDDEGNISALNPGYATVRVNGAGLEAYLTLTVKSLELTQSEINIFVNQTETLEPVFLPEGLPESEKNLEWVSYNPDLVKVNNMGVITALKATAEPAIVSAQCGDLVAECRISVTDYQIDAVELANIDALKQEDGSYQMLMGDKPFDLGVIFKKDGEDVTETVQNLGVKVSYISSDPDVAGIDKTGSISLKSPGTTTISVGCAGQTESFILNVIQCVESVKIISPEANPYILGPEATGFTVEYKVYPETATFKRVTFSSSNTDVAEVDPNTGVVTFPNRVEGSAQIILTTEGMKRPYVDNTGATVVEPAKVSLVLVVSDESSRPAISISGQGVQDGRLEMRKLDKVRLAASVENEEYTGSFAWSTTTSDIISVSEDGEVTALACGTGKVVVVAGGAAAELIVTVTGIDPTAIQIDQDYKEKYVSDKHFSLTASIVAPAYGDFGGVNWYSSNTVVATVDAEGQVTVLKEGTVTFTAKALSSDGSRELEDVSATLTVVFKTVPVTDVRVNLPATKLQVGESMQLSFEVIPLEAGERRGSWSFEDGSDSQYASITGTGMLTGIQSKQVVDDITGVRSWRSVTVKVTVDGVTATAQVMIIPKQPTGIEFDLPEAGTLRINQTWNFNPRTLPDDLAGFRVAAYGSLPNGNYFAPNVYNFVPETPGAYRITFYVEQTDNLVIDYQHQRNVTVVANPYWVKSISLPQTKNIMVGATTAITPEFESDVEGVQPTDKKLTWTSSNPEIATVDASGRIYAKARGTVEITVTTAGNWSVPSGSEHKSATCRVVVNDPEKPLHIGDFVYTDGDWSTELNSSKTVAGIVFALTDATSSDPILAKDYPGCVNGLAMSVKEYVTDIKMNGTESAQYTWGNVNDFALSKGGYLSMTETGIICGYNNTAAMKAFKAEKGEYSHYLDQLDKQAATVVNHASSWYLPSLYEMSLISESFSKINASLAKLADAPLMPDFVNSWTAAEYVGAYWHSTWNNDNTSSLLWIMQRKENRVALMSYDHPVRFVFAF